MNKKMNKKMLKNWSEILPKLLAAAKATPCTVVGDQSTYSDVHAMVAARLFQCKQTDVTVDQREAAQQLMFSYLWGSKETKNAALDFADGR